MTPATMRKYLIIAAALPAVLAGCRKDRGPETARVTVGDKTWIVEVARTDTQQYAGLSGRSDLPNDRGMLFAYPTPRILEFCMRGCAHPLDIAFIDAEGHIVRLTTMRPERDLTGQVIYSSGVPVIYALEVAGGSFQRAGVAAGDQVSVTDISND